MTIFRPEDHLVGGVYQKWKLFTYTQFRTPTHLTSNTALKSHLQKSIVGTGNQKKMIQCLHVKFSSCFWRNRKSVELQELRFNTEAEKS